jgi:hypothetical protein
MVVKKAVGKTTKKPVKPTMAEPEVKEPERVTVVTEVIEDTFQPIGSSGKTSPVNSNIVDEEGVGSYQAKEISEAWPTDLPPKDEVGTGEGEEGKRKEIVEQLFKPPETSDIMPEISEHKNGSSRQIFMWSIIVIWIGDKK